MPSVRSLSYSVTTLRPSTSSGVISNRTPSVTSQWSYPGRVTPYTAVSGCLLRRQVDHSGYLMPSVPTVGKPWTWKRNGSSASRAYMLPVRAWYCHCLLCIASQCLSVKSDTVHLQWTLPGRFDLSSCRSSITPASHGGSVRLYQISQNWLIIRKGYAWEEAYTDFIMNVCNVHILTNLRCAVLQEIQFNVCNFYLKRVLVWESWGFYGVSV